MATSTGSLGAIEIFNSGVGNDAFMAFHTQGDFAMYFGLDADANDLAVGGWSMGAAKYKIWHQNNDGSGSGLDADLLDGQQGSYYKDTPSGTVVVFYQSSAPTGWTKVTSQDNKALRVVSGTGGGSGGSNNFTTAFNSSRSTSGGSVNNHTLSEAQMPSHQHHGRAPNHDNNSASSQGWPANNNHNAFRTSDRARDKTMHIDAIAPRGSSQSHNHGFSNPSINLNVQYINVIICSRNS
jgi:microcystin-dependent protein